MKKKFLGRLLTMLLVAAMVFTLLPASAIAAAEWWGGDEYADDAATQATETKYEYNIFFLDCGRKYYSVDSIKQFIDNASAAGFNYIQLAVGNDGLRFLLNDMSLTVNGTTYESDAVKSAIHTGNEAYYNFDVDELTQSEMDTIIAYASSKGMGVIPCVNSPGHMDAIIDCMESLGMSNVAFDAGSYGVSVRTIDVTNSEAVAFTQALLEKYVAYFAGKGCKFFNMGADEYANDKLINYAGMGFGYLQNKGTYSYYVDYVNAVAKLIEKYQATPMAFNDGIYYGGNTTSGTFDKNIIICYWSSGWPSYTPMSASNLASKGFKLINTHGDYYWVLGKTDAQCSASKASGFNYKTFPGSTIDAPAGSMFCIWADYPGALTEDKVISGTADTIAAFGSALPEVSSTPVEPGTDIVITPDGGTSGSTGSVIKPNAQIKLTASKEVYWTSSAPEVVKLTSADTDVAAQAATYDVYAKSVYATAVGEGTAEILADDGNGNTATYSLTVSAQSTATKKATINLEIGGSDKVTVEGYNYSNAADQDRSKLDEKIATVDVTANKTGPTYSSNASSQYLLTVANGVSDSWTKTAYGYKTNGSIYPVYAKKVNYQYYIAYSISGNGDDITDGTTLKKSYNPYDTVNVYTRTSEGTDVPASTTITFTGHSYGTTYVTVGDTEYTINVAKKTATKTILLTGGRQYYTDNSKTTTVTNSNPEVADAELSGTNLVVTPKAVGTTTITTDYCVYTITVTKEDLNAVTPLTIEYWITNTRITANSSNEMDIRADAYDSNNNAVNSPTGVKFADLVPEDGTTNDNKPATFWKVKLFGSDGKQTIAKGDDKTPDAYGSNFAFVRYYDQKWSFSNDGTNWTDYTSGDQIVAYYLQVTEVTKEITTKVSDWGPDRASYNSYNFVLLDFAVVYENGTKDPTKFPVANKTIAFHCDSTDTSTVHEDSNGNYYRTIGTIHAEETSDFEVYMITVTPSNDHNSSAYSVGSTADTASTYTYDGTEKAIWVDDMNDLPTDFADASKQYNGAVRVGGEASISSLNIYNKHAMLVTYYLRTKQTETSLTVNYVDKAAPSKPFYTYNIAVNGKTFDSGIALNPANMNGDLLNGQVEGIYQTLTVSADLKTLPQISAKYLYSKYNCFELEKSDDLKTITLYYTFDNSDSFVVDFGLPLVITAADLGYTMTDWDSSSYTESSLYGKATLDKTNHTLTYTPDKVMQGAETINITVTGEGEPNTRNIYIYPASNVLYEESFLTGAAGWDNGTTSAAPTTAQETQKAKETKNVFGYDEVYANKTGELGVLKTTKELKLADLTEPLTTEFYGNAFDLIGNCGPTTGRVMLTFTKDGASTPSVIRIIDTRFTDDSQSQSQLVQVPLAHVDLGETNAHYVVNVYASGSNGTASNSGSASLRAYSYTANADGFDALLSSYDLSKVDIEYVNVANTANVASYAAMSTADVQTAKNLQAGTHVEIDGFRVYRSTTDDVANNYPDNEQKVIYKNIINFMADKVITAYIENEGVQSVAVNEYESKGGPENEIYLGKKELTAFKINGVTEIQVSLRAVNDPVTWSCDSEGGTIKSNTEMYYTVKADPNGVFTIANTSDKLLAIGNVKIPNTVAETNIVTADEIDDQVLLSSARAAFATSLPVDPEPDQTVFVPEHFSIRNYATPLFRHKLVTLRIDFSKDVSYVEIDGQKYYPSKFASWFGYYTVTFTDTIGRNDNYFYKVVFFDANGNPSETQSVYGK